MAILQLLIIMNYSPGIVGFLRVKCRPIFDTEPDPTHGWTWLMSNSEQTPVSCLTFRRFTKFNIVLNFLKYC